MSAVTRVDKTFSFLYTADLSPVGQSQTVYVTGTSNSPYGISNTAITVDESFTLTFPNPCADSSATWIIQGTDPDSADQDLLANIEYKAFDEKKKANPLVEHSVYTLVPNGLCDGLTVKYTGFYDGELLDIKINTKINDVMLFDITQFNKFKVEDVRLSMVGQVKPYSLQVEIAEYPLASNPNAGLKAYNATLTFLDPSGEITQAECEDPLVTSWTPED